MIDRNFGIQRPNVKDTKIRYSTYAGLCDQALSTAVTANKVMSRSKRADAPLSQIFIEITDFTGSPGHYGARQVIWDASSAAWVAQTSGFNFGPDSGDDYGNVYEINNSSYVPKNFVTPAYRTIDDDGGQDIWVFEYPSYDGPFKVTVDTSTNTTLYVGEDRGDADYPHSDIAIFRDQDGNTSRVIKTAAESLTGINSDRYLYYEYTEVSGSPVLTLKSSTTWTPPPNRTGLTSWYVLIAYVEADGVNGITSISQYLYGNISEVIPRQNTDFRGSVYDSAGTAKLYIQPGQIIFGDQSTRLAATDVTLPGTTTYYYVSATYTRGSTTSTRGTISATLSTSATRPTLRATATDTVTFNVVVGYVNSLGNWIQEHEGCLTVEEEQGLVKVDKDGSALWLSDAITDGEDNDYDTTDSIPVRGATDETANEIQLYFNDLGSISTATAVAGKKILLETTTPDLEKMDFGDAVWDEMKSYSGYNGSATRQFLIHESGTPKWIDGDVC